MAGTAELPSSVAARVVPGLCRLALEAACMEAVRRRRLTRGESHGEVERLLERGGRPLRPRRPGALRRREAPQGRRARLEKEAGPPLAEAYRRCETGGEVKADGGPRPRSARQQARGVAPGRGIERRRSPREVLDLAGHLLARADPLTAGLWPRASALLAARRCESTLARLWVRRQLDLQGCSMRAQLICLRTYLGDADLAARAGHAWSALSRASHHHAYELAPTATELQRLARGRRRADSASRLTGEPAYHSAAERRQRNVETLAAAVRGRRPPGWAATWRRSSAWRALPTTPSGSPRSRAGSATACASAAWPRSCAPAPRGGRRCSPASAGATGAILFLGHHDTVWPAGTLATFPFRVQGERASGPGVFDMKAGIAVAMAVLAELDQGAPAARGDAPAHPRRGSGDGRLPRAAPLRGPQATGRSWCSSPRRTARPRSRARARAPSR